MAANFNIFRKPDRTWSVPSQSSKGHRYAVRLGPEPCCTCQYHELRRTKYKHLHAVEYFVSSERHQDGSETLSQTLRVTETIQRKTYPRVWSAYNAAQCNEKTRVAELLRDLRSGIKQPPHSMGLSWLFLSDAVFSAVMKVYSTVSGRRAMCNLSDFQSNGLISKAPHYNSVFLHLRNRALTPILKSIVEESAEPLKSIETFFAGDSSCCATSTYVRWSDEKYGKYRSEHSWVKAHIMVGTQTQVATVVEVTEPTSHDFPYLPQTGCLIRSLIE